MILSMTAFAREESRGDWGTLCWELRSVNNRYLDISPRLPDDLRALESAVRERVSAKVKRGKVECSLRFRPATDQDAQLNLNLELAGRIAKASRTIDGLLYNPSPAHSLDVLRWPGVIEASAPDLEVLSPPTLELLDTALDDLVSTRAREGAKIAEMVSDRLGQMDAKVKEVRTRLPGILQGFRDRLKARLEDVRKELDPDRLEQEMVIFAQKADVDEELDRLDAHIAEVRRVLQQKKPAGRRLDFLMQEMNREANTLGSKSVDTETTRISVDLKVLIEQMREQVQNVE